MLFILNELLYYTLNVGKTQRHRIHRNEEKEESRDE